MTETTINPIDLTPKNWSIPEPMLLEKAKRLLRSMCIPPYLKVIHSILKKRYPNQLPFPVGGRGMAMEILHRKACHFAEGIKGKYATAWQKPQKADPDIPTTFTQTDLAEYIRALEQFDFKKIHHSAVIEPRPVHCLANHPSLRTQLLKLHHEINLITGGLMVVYHA